MSKAEAMLKQAPRKQLEPELEVEVELQPEVEKDSTTFRPSSVRANRSTTRQVDNGLTPDEAKRILRAARVEITRVLGPIRQWPPNMRPESILAQHEVDAEAIAGATNRVVGRMYAERNRKLQQVRYHRSKLEELLGEAMES